MQSLFARMFLAFALVTVGATIAVSTFYDSTIAARQERRLAQLDEAIATHGEEAVRHASEGEAEAAETELSALHDQLAASITDTHDRSSIRTVRIVLLVIATALVSLLLARVLTRPIRTLQSATRRIAEGDTSVRVGNEARGAGDEIAGLAADFDRMTERIEGLLEARETLLRDVSHELRSPLARLQVALGIARQRGGADAALLDRMEKETERLGELIGLVLSMAQLEQAKALPSATDVRLDELVASLASDASFEAAGSEREVTVVRTEEVTVRGDGELLRRAAENVVRNALRFAPDGTAVEIVVERVNGASVELRVRDHGPGVPDDALGEIFRPFTRVEAARDRGSGGAGIGLAITERAVRLHAGEVSASNAPGGGLEVTIRLPIGA
jgi:two-component system sensor histidine kinase CpxA